jgi:hypothetical protein
MSTINKNANLVKTEEERDNEINLNNYVSVPVYVPKDEEEANRIQYEVDQINSRDGVHLGMPQKRN